MVPYVDAVVVVMRLLKSVVHVCIMRECARVTEMLVMEEA